MQEKLNPNRAVILTRTLACAAVFIAGFVSAALFFRPPQSAVEPTGQNQALARIADRTISVDEFQDELARYGRRAPDRFKTVEQKRELLTRLMNRELLIAAAQRAGYDRNPDVVGACERMLAAKFQDETIDRELEDIAITDDEIAAFHAGHPELYEIRGRARAAIIRASAPATAEERERVRQRLETARAEALNLPSDVAHFGQVAFRFSDDAATRFVGGDIGALVPGKAYRWPAEVVDAAFAMNETGEISPVIEADGAYWIVRLSSRTPASMRPLEQVAAAIRHELTRQKAASLKTAFFARLDADLPMTVEESLLSAIEGPEFKLRPPALPGQASQ